MMSSTCFKPEGLSPGRWLYVQVWYNFAYIINKIVISVYKQIKPYLYIQLPS